MRSRARGGYYDVGRLGLLSRVMTGDSGPSHPLSYQVSDVLDALCPPLAAAAFPVFGDFFM